MNVGPNYIPLTPAITFFALPTLLLVLVKVTNFYQRYRR